MVKYLRRARDAKGMTAGKKPVVVRNYSEILQAATNLDFEHEYLLIDNLPIIRKRYYVRGEQTIHNRYEKHADPLELRCYGSQKAANDEAIPFYIQRRDAFAELSRRWMQARRTKGYHLVENSCLAWMQPGGEGVTYLTLVDSFKSLERLLTSNKKKPAPEKIHLSCAYGPDDKVEKQGVSIAFSLPSIGEDKQYSMQENSLEHVPFVNNPMMYTLAMWMRPKHNCGTSTNKGLRFKAIRGLKNNHYICEHSGAAYLEMVRIQEAVRRNPDLASKFPNFSRADTVYDRFYKKTTSVPMYLCPIPLPTREELKLFRALYHHTVITRPKKDKQKGGFKKKDDGSIVFDKPRRLSEQEIESILWTHVAERGAKALFADERIKDYEAYLFGLVAAR